MERLRLYGRHIEAEVARFEKDGLSQNDPCFQNVGWRMNGDQRELVVFDLEGFKVGHRFADAISVMTDLRERDCVLSDAAMRAYFLSEYERHGGPPVSRARFDENVACFAVGEQFWSLPFAYQISIGGTLIDWTDDIEAGKRECRQNLLRKLSRLLRDASEAQQLASE